MGAVNMNKKVIVTGASRGIGRALAFELANRGYDLFLIARRSGEALAEIKREIKESYGTACETALCDVGDPKEVWSVLSGAVKDGIYGLVNNAGIASYSLVTDLEEKEWQRIMEVDLNSCFYTAKAVIPEMVRAREGRIINVSSVWGNVGASMEVAYSTAKGGVNAFTKALAKELGPSNIKVNAVSFGLIRTQMNDHLSSEELKALTEEIPMDRMGEPEEAAKMIADVLEAPDYLTGQVITMDGGWI